MTKVTPGYVGRSVYRLNLDSRFQRIDPTNESYTGLKAIDYTITVVVAQVELYLSPEPGVVYDMYVTKIQMH